MRDLKIRLKHQPGALAALGEALAKEGVSVEGGGVFSEGNDAIAHFLFEDAEKAKRVLTAAGIEVLDDREVVAQRLHQAVPGQLGKIARRMADAGVNIELMYSDHDHQLILGVDDVPKARAVSDAWASEGAGPRQGRAHEYAVSLRWTGNAGTGTSGYRDYKRDHELTSEGKPTLLASSDPVFRGDRERWNPEDLLVAALSSCHLLSYLHVCVTAGIVVTAYEDRAEGVMREDNANGGAFTRVVLRPKVTLAPGSDRAKADALHHEAHAKCFIASSVNFPVEVEPELA